jgi:hypothetical protein
MGRLAEYYGHLAAFPGLRLEPLRDVAVQDGPRAAGLTRFRLEGTAP